MSIMGNIWGGGVDEAPKKPHRGCWKASSRLMISLFEADEKPHGQWHDRGEARTKPRRGWWETSCSRTWSEWGSQQASSRLMGNLFEADEKPRTCMSMCMRRSARSLSKLIKSTEQTNAHSGCAVARKRQVLYFSLELMLYKEPSFGKNKILLAHMELWSYQRKTLVKLFVVSSMEGFNWKWKNPTARRRNIFFLLYLSTG